jgi:hypothetical protein
MLARLPRKASCIPVQATAEDLGSGRAKLPVDTVDRLLIKEAVHPFCDPSSTLAGLAR